MVEPLSPTSVYCAKNIRIPSFSGQYFPAFGLNAEICSVNLRIPSKYGKIRTIKTRNTDTFYATVILVREPIHTSHLISILMMGTALVRDWQLRWNWTLRNVSLFGDRLDLLHLCDYKASCVWRRLCLNSVGKRTQKCDRKNRELRWRQIKSIYRWYLDLVVVLIAVLII